MSSCKTAKFSPSTQRLYLVKDSFEVQDFIRSFLRSLRERFLPYFSCSHPATFCSILFPTTFVHDTGLRWDCKTGILQEGDAYVDNLVNMSQEYIVSWIDMLNPVPSVEGSDKDGPLDHMSERIKRMKMSVSINSNVPSCDSTCCFRLYLIEILKHSKTLSVVRSKKIYELKIDDLEAIIQNGHDTFDIILSCLNVDSRLVHAIRNVFKLFYSSSATSAETERIFSTSKYIDVALRQSMSDTKLEFRLVVTRFLHWLLEKKKLDDFFDYLSNLIRTPSELEKAIHYIF